MTSDIILNSITRPIAKVIKIRMQRFNLTFDKWVLYVDNYQNIALASNQIPSSKLVNFLNSTISRMQVDFNQLNRDNQIYLISGEAPIDGSYCNLYDLNNMLESDIDMLINNNTRWNNTHKGNEKSKPSTYQQYASQAEGDIYFRFITRNDYIANWNPIMYRLKLLTTDCQIRCVPDVQLTHSRVQLQIQQPQPIED